jgi:GNAT superfamily N-acetyltransferase
VERARAAVDADAGRLVELADEALAEISARRGGSQLAHDVLAGRSVPQAVAAAMANPDAEVIVGELNGAALGIGMASIDHTRSTATVELLYVEPEARAVGLGEVMLDALAAWAGSRGCTAIDAAALPGSREAKAFFETHGMVARLLVMHRALAGAGRRIPPAGEAR